MTLVTADILSATSPLGTPRYLRGVQLGIQAASKLGADGYRVGGTSWGFPLLLTHHVTGDDEG